MSLDILFPNGQVLATLGYIDDPLLGIIPWDGTISIAPVVGGATSANQVLEIAALNSIDSKLTNPLPVTVSNMIPPVETGLATEATLFTVLSAVATMHSDLTNNNVGVIQGANGSPTIPWFFSLTDGAGNFAGINGAGQISVTNPFFTLISAKTNNLDVLLSTRLKPADTLAGITLVSTLTSITNPVAVTNANLDSPLSTKASAANQATEIASLASIDAKLTSPLTVQALNLDIRDLAFATDKVDVSGSSVQPLPLFASAGVRTNLNALNAFAEVDVQGFVGCCYILEAGTFVGTIACTISFDSINYFDFAAFSAGGTKFNTKSYSFPSPRQVIQPILSQGVKKVRLTVIAFTSGSAFATGYSNTLSDVFGASLTAQSRGFAPNIGLIGQVGGLDENGLMEELHFCSTTPGLTDAGVVVREASGNLAAIAAEIGTLDANPSVFSVLDRLKRIETAVNNNTKLGATEASTKNIVALLAKVPPNSSSLPLYSMRGIR